MLKYKLIDDIDYTTRETITILTYNTKCLPMSYKREYRIKQICQEIKNKGYEIVCLQELFDERCRDIAVMELLKEYPYQIQKSQYNYSGIINWFNWLEDSGLFVASKYPITWHDFQPFWDATGADAKSWKGILGFTVNLHEKKLNSNIMIFTTHLQAGNNTEIKKKQIECINKFMEEQHIQTGILCGDLNIDENDKAMYTYMLETLDCVDLYRKTYTNVTENPGYTMDGRKNKNMMTSDYKARLDYILDISHNAVVSNIEINYFGKPANDLYSDHFGVAATIEINGSENKGNSGFNHGKKISRICTACFSGFQ